MEQLIKTANPANRLAPLRAQADCLPATAESQGYGYELAPEEPAASGVLELWRLLNRHRSALLVSAFVGGLIALLVTLPQTPIYQARTSIEILGFNENFLNMKQVSPTSESSPSSETVDIQTQLKVLESDSLILRVLDKLHAENMADEPAAMGRLETWRQAFHPVGHSELDRQERSLKMAAKNLSVHAAPQTRILEIRYDSVDPGKAAEFVNALANEYIEQNLESRWKTTERTGVFLSKQLEDMRSRLERSEDQLQSYARKAGLMFTSDNSNVSEEKLLQLQQALSAAQADRVAKQSRFEMAQTASPESLPDILSDTALRDYQEQLTTLRRQVAELGATYTPDYYKVKRAEAQIVTVESSLEGKRGAILERIRNEYQESDRKVKLLAASYAEQAKLVTGESEKSIQYNILKREVDSTRQLYDTMLQKMKEASVASAMRASNIRILDPARAPRRPYKPDVFVNAGVGMLSGVLLGGLIIVIRERADRTIQQPGETAMYLNLTELGVIPAGEAAPMKRLSRGAKELPAPGADDYSGRIELVTWQQKPSMIAESFRAALMSILFSRNGGDPPRVLVLTSSSPSEGKSTVVSNLGVAIAEIGQRVLLVDADMRKPRLHDVFGLANRRGLSDLLREKRSVDEDETFEETIKETKVPGLFVLTSGPSTPAATNLLYNPQMPELLRRFRQEFDTVLIDTPPMLHIPDARVLGRMADTVVLVVRTGKTTRDAALAARQRFAEDGTPVLGTILNDWNPKSSPSGYYGYYNGYHKTYRNYYGKSGAA